MLFRMFFGLLNIAPDLTTTMTSLSSSADSLEIQFAIDWTQFVPEVIATFFGFALALLGQWFWEYMQDKNSAKKLIDRIASELKAIYAVICSIEEGAIDVEPLKTPTWTACLNTGEVKVLNIDMQRELFLVYNSIKEYNYWSMTQVSFYFQNEKLNKELTKELVGIRTHLAQTIPEMLSILNGV